MVFPFLRGGKFGYLNLNHELPREYAALKRPDDTSVNELLNPDICEFVLSRVHKKLSLDWSYGGWGEDREEFLRLSYLEEFGTFRHLGVDFNVPDGTAVCVDRKAKVVRVDTDCPEMGGWGRRVIVHLVEHPDIYLIYAHLAETVQCKKGQMLGAGQIFAEVGPSSENGGWFPHLHIQALVQSVWQTFLKNPRSLDGYGKKSDWQRLAQLHPDPMQWINLS